jgi:hypothetical protein
MYMYVRLSDHFTSQIANTDAILCRKTTEELKDKE